MFCRCQNKLLIKVFEIDKNNDEKIIFFAGRIVNEKGIPVTEEREYRPLESIKDNYPKYVLTLDYLLQQRNGIKHENIINFLIDKKLF